MTDPIPVYILSEAELRAIDHQRRRNREISVIISILVAGALAWVLCGGPSPIFAFHDRLSATWLTAAVLGFPFLVLGVAWPISDRWGVGLVRSCGPWLFGGLVALLIAVLFSWSEPAPPAGLFG